MSAIGSGYTESKWICEQISAVAAERTALKPIVEDMYAEIRSSVTHIIHNGVCCRFSFRTSHGIRLAYTVNFYLSLSSFEPNIAGLRRLIDLALSSPHATPPRLLFTSSIGVVRNCTVDGPVPEDHVDTMSAIGSGYTESKWVCEQILAVAAERTALKPIVIRIG